MSLSTAFYLSASWNLLHSGMEAIDAWLPNLSLNVLNSRYTLPKLSSNIRRISHLSALINFPLSASDNKVSKIKIIPEKIQHLACAHGDLKNGIISLHPRLLAHQSEDLELYTEKHVLLNCTQEKADFDELLDTSPNDGHQLNNFLHKNVSPETAHRLQSRVHFLEVDLNELELCFLLEHEKGHLTHADRQSTFKCSSALRLSAACLAEVATAIFLSQYKVAFFGAHLAGYLLGNVAVKGLVQRRQEYAADTFAAENQGCAAGGVRLFKRAIVLEWLQQSTAVKKCCPTKLQNSQRSLGYPSHQARLAHCAKFLVPSGQAA